MSGVRVCDEDLLRIGLTMPGFVERDKVIASLPSLGLLTLAAHTPDHWRIEYRDHDAGDFDAAEVAREFDLIAISSLSARAFDAYALADGLRAFGAKVILGGLHATTQPEEASRHSDAVVVGEGEPVWSLLLADFEAGSLQSRYEARRPFDLADSRVPRYDLLEIERYNRLTLQTTRGCPRACHFCGASRLLGPYRRKPIDLVARELDAILAIWPQPFLELADDNTFLDRDWSMRLARLLAGYPVRWFSEADVSVADHEPLLDALAVSGCAQLLIGFESPKVASLSTMDPAGWKASRLDGYAEAVQKIQARGIGVIGCFVVGWDEDDDSVFEATRDAAETLELADVQVTIATPFSGTEFHDRLRHEGRLLTPTPWREATLFDLAFEPKRMSRDALVSGFHWLVREVYSDEAVARRRRTFGACRRAQRRLGA